MSAPTPVTLAEAERMAIVSAMRYCMGNKEGAAWKLGIGKSTLYRKIRELEIREEEWAGGDR